MILPFGYEDVMIFLKQIIENRVSYKLTTENYKYVNSHLQPWYCNDEIWKIGTFCRVDIPRRKNFGNYLR